MLVARCSDQSISTRNTVWSLPNFKGPQGSGKSSAIRILSNGWFAELEGFTWKESAEVLAGGVWLVELSELDGMKRSDVESVKRFITTPTERYRPAYGRHVVSIPRSFVFAGSTNETSYLHDSTGNRRFWPVSVQTFIWSKGSAKSNTRVYNIQDTSLNLLAGVSSTSHFNVWFCIKHSHELSYEPLCRQHCELNGWGDGERVKYL